MIEIKHKDTEEVLCRVDADTLASADLRGANLTRARLTRVYLTHADLRYARLGQAELRHANLRQANLDDTCLVEADLSRAILIQASLRRANLEQADLEGAFLCGADLQRANLSGAKLRGADLTRTDLTDANLEGTDLETVRYDAGTKWPASPDPGGPPPRAGSTDRGRNTFRSSQTYRVNKPRPGTVPLWTIQELTLWEHLNRCRVLYADPACIDPDLLPAYQWMREQMARRVSCYGGHYPWWAWFRPKPDLRREAYFPHFPSGIRRVRLELAVPKERVLVSDYVGWHMVLSRSYLALTESEREAWEAELNRSGVNFTTWPLPEPWHSRLLASWERIFDLEALAPGGNWFTDQVQATLGWLELADVVEVTEFTTR